MDSSTPDPYNVLGVDRDASLPTIRNAYRKLVLKCHPDKVQDPALKATKQDEFQRVQKAYDILSDETQRANYDSKSKLAFLKAEREDFIAFALKLFDEVRVVEWPGRDCAVNVTAPERSGGGAGRTIPGLRRMAV
jgi:curved DNA-binding protein CbpA